MDTNIIKRKNMKKITIMLSLLMSLALVNGCTTQPSPPLSGGKSKTATLSGNETEFMTGKFTLFSIGATNINAKDGSTITFVPNPPTLANQHNPF